MISFETSKTNRLRNVRDSLNARRKALEAQIDELQAQADALGERESRADDLYSDSWGLDFDAFKRVGPMTDAQREAAWATVLALAGGAK